MANEAEIAKAIADIRARLDDLEGLVTPNLPDVRKLAKRALDTWRTLWADRHREPYDTKWAADRTHVNRWLAQGHTIERIEAKMAVFVLDNDPALVRARHPFDWFVKRFSTIRVDVDADRPAAPIDCRHSPRCSSEIAHTRKAMQESRT